MQRSSNAVVILVLGILSVTGFGFLTGIPAWIMGNQELSGMREGRVDSTDMSMVQVGRVLGMVVSILSIVGICLFTVFWFGLFALIAGTSTMPK